MGEVMAIDDADLAGGEIHRFKGKILVHILHLRHGRVGGTVRTHHAVAEEVAIAGGVHTVIPSIGVVEAALLVIRFHGLVDPVPYIASLQVGIFVYRLPLYIEVAV